jgi:gluconate kinase
MSLNSLRTDMLNMIKLSAEISKYEQMFLHCSNLKDEYNYNEKKGDTIKTKIVHLEKQFSSLKEKWFDI